MNESGAYLPDGQLFAFAATQAFGEYETFTPSNVPDSLMRTLECTLNFPAAPVGGQIEELFLRRYTGTLVERDPVIDCAPIRPG